MVLAAVLMLLCMSGTGSAYIELTAYSTSPTMAYMPVLELVVHQFTLGYKVYADEAIGNCSVVYAYMMFEPYVLFPDDDRFLGYDTVILDYNATDVLADNSTWNFITVSLPVRDEAVSRYVADLQCEGVDGGYDELGCVSGCLLPIELSVWDYTERETTFRNLAAASNLGTLVAGPILGMSENLSITRVLSMVIIIVVISSVVILVKTYV